MQRTLNQLLKVAVEIKPRILSFNTTYSHDNIYIYDWLQAILLTDWTIIIPGASCVIQLVCNRNYSKCCKTVA